MTVDDDPERAYAAYVTACEERARLAALAAARPSLEEQLTQRVLAEEMASGQAETLVEAERQLYEALEAWGSARRQRSRHWPGFEAWEQQLVSRSQALGHRAFGMVRVRFSARRSIVRGTDRVS